MEKEEVRAGFLCGYPRERDHLQDLDIGGRIILKWIYKKWAGKAWNGFVWLTIGTGGGCL